MKTKVTKSINLVFDSDRLAKDERRERVCIGIVMFDPRSDACETWLGSVSPTGAEKFKAEIERYVVSK